MITVTGDAKITMGGQDVTKTVTDKDFVSIEGLGCKIEVCQHESDGRNYGRLEWGGENKFRCKKCGDFYK